MGSGNASAAQRRHPGWSRPSRVDLRSNEHQILRVLAATFKEPPPARSPACRDQQALGPVVRKLQKPEPHQWHDGPFPERLFLEIAARPDQVPSGRVPLGGRRHTMPCPVRPLALAEMNRQMVQNAVRGRGGIKAQSIVCPAATSLAAGMAGSP